MGEGLSCVRRKVEALCPLSVDLGSTGFAISLLQIH